MLYDLIIYTDGACQPNPGKGGYGIVFQDPKTKSVVEHSGYEPQTTNNRMELTAVLVALKALQHTPGKRIRFVTDSKYVCFGLDVEKLERIQRLGWKRGKNAKAIIPNHDLWEEVLPLLKLHTVDCHWVRGHNGHPMNERCDELAVNAINRFRKQ